MSTNLHANDVRKLRKLFQWRLDGFEITKEEAKEGLRILAPAKRSEKVKAYGRAARAEKQTEIAAHRMTTKEIRAACMERANGRCEYVCPDRPGEPTRCSLRADHMDHWEGGSGRRRPKQSVENCWVLCTWHDLLRTRNAPDSAFWNARFEMHCRKYGYRFYAHVEHKPLPRRGTA